MKKFELNKTYEGFVLLRKEFINEINSTALIFEHQKTAARLLCLQNDDNEYSFGIGFRTPPTDDTGLPHILEHSVLCGSDNFQIKDPFANLSRGTINTFTNAFTYSDKTVYPFATTNQNEFKKIMHIYVDAVFKPLIYKHKEIFLQEGWRFTLENKDSELKYSGVVYGEMKGAYSSPDRVLEMEQLRSLFPNNCYNKESGGDPRHIPDLKYEDFLDFHSKYYHPTNSFIYLYGNTNFVEHMKFLNEEYLSKYDKIEIDSTVQYQKSITIPVEKTIYYSISKEESTKNKSYIDLSFLIGKNADSKLTLGFDILTTILLGMSGSPLYQILKKSNLGEDVIGDFEKNEPLQTIFTITLKNTSPKNKERFVKLFFNTLEELKTKGINKDLIKAAINLKEFELKEKDHDHLPLGLQYYTEVLTTWLYDEDPLLHLKYQKNLDEIKKESNTGYFENLIDKYFLKNNHKATIVLEPNSNINFDKEVDEKLRQIKSKMSKEELNAIIEQDKQLNEYQDELEKDADKIKTIELDEIDELPRKTNIEVITQDNNKILLHKLNTKGITYIEMFFDASIISKDKIQYLELLTDLIPETRTTNYSLEEFSNLRNIYTGGVRYSITPITNDKTNELMPKFCVSSKAIGNNITKLVEIFNEIFNNIIFDETKAKESINKIKVRMQQNIIERGHSYAYQKIKSHITNTGQYEELINGIDFYQFIKHLSENFEKEKKNLMKEIQTVYETIFNKENLIISITTQNDNLDYLKKLDIKNKHFEKQNFIFNLKRNNEAIITPSNVNYVGKGFNYKKIGVKPSGSFIVLSNYLRYKFLWDKLRLKGGAYGAIPIVRRDGSFIMVSYRDPRIKGTLEDYDTLPNTLNKLKFTEEEMRSYIVGSINDLDMPLKPAEEGMIASLNYIKNVTYEDKVKERKEVLSTTINDFKIFAPKIKEMFDKNYHCTIGNEKSIKENKNLFDEIINPFK